MITGVGAFHSGYDPEIGNIVAPGVFLSGRTNNFVAGLSGFLLSCVGKITGWLPCGVERCWIRVGEFHDRNMTDFRGIARDGFVTWNAVASVVRARHLW